jgi:hypothetical protein
MAMKKHHNLDRNQKKKQWAHLLEYGVKSMNEIWKEIDGYDGIYEVSNKGRVKSLARFDLQGHKLKERILRPAVNSSGYCTVCLSKGGHRRLFTVHRLVAQTFISNPENKPSVNHIDGDKTNNATTNLEWNTYLENMRHAINTGLKKDKGEKHGNSKLTEKQVIEIHQRATKGEKLLEIAKDFGISFQHVSDIKHGRRWNFLTKPHKNEVNIP